MLDAAYLADLLAKFDAYYGLCFEEPGYPLEPVEYPRWKLVRASVAGRAADIVLATNHCPDWLSDYVLPRAETYCLAVGR